MASSNDAELTISGHSVRLYFNSLTEILIGLDKKKARDNNSGLSSAEHFAEAIQHFHLLDGMRDEPVLVSIAESAGVDITSDSSLIDFISTPDRKVPYFPLRKTIIENILKVTDNPEIFKEITSRAFRYSQKLGVVAKYMGNPEAILHRTHTFDAELNTLLDMREIGAVKGGSLQFGKYDIVPLIFDEQFTQSVTASAPRNVSFYNSPRFVMRCVPTHSQSRVEDTVLAMNTFFGANLSLESEGIELFIGDGNATEYFGKRVSLLEMQQLVEKSKGVSLSELEGVLAPVEGVHYSPISRMMADRDDLPNTAILCERDVYVNEKRIFRAGQFYNSEACFDHFYYQTRGGIFVVLAGLSNIGSAKKFQQAFEDNQTFLRKLANEQAIGNVKLLDEQERRFNEEKKRHEAETRQLKAEKKAALEAREKESLRRELEGSLSEVNRLYTYQNQLMGWAHDIKNDQAAVRMVCLARLKQIYLIAEGEVPFELSQDDLKTSSSLEAKIGDIVEGFSGTEYVGELESIQKVLSRSGSSYTYAQLIMGKKIEVPKEKVNYAEFLDRVISDARVLNSSEVDISLTVGPDVEVEISPRDLKAAYINILDNVLDASIGGYARIEVKRMGAKVMTIINQSGVLDPVIAQKLTRGERVGSTKGDRGHGVGTVASYNIIKDAHKGAIMYDSLGESGARIRILF
ncbi:hypothetical protein HN587_05850 [Candidatus Woesearchaeota archaeon]|nr:hypothetical protein [Candidatus Woesearchaeota archaeon]